MSQRIRTTNFDANVLKAGDIVFSESLKEMLYISSVIYEDRLKELANTLKGQNCLVILITLVYLVATVELFSDQWL